MRKLATGIAAVSAAALFLSGCSSDTGGGSPRATAAPGGTNESGLPSQMVWTSYGVGTSAYAELGAVSEALISTYDTSIRTVTSDTGIGRLTPMKGGQAQMARLSDEAFYAFEASYEFAAPDWGPQDIRTVWTPPTTVGVGVNTNSGIETLADLKGKKVPWMPANPSGQEKIEGILAYAGVSPDEVEKVEVDYSAQPKALQDGQIDMAYFGVQSSSIIEVANQMDFEWIDFGEDEEAEKRLQEMAPTVTVEEFESAVGLDGETKTAPTYSIQMATYAEYSADETYAVVKAFDETFDDYKDATTTTKYWDIELIDWMPRVLPHHDGTVRYLTEQGIWTDEHEAANQALIERGEQLREGWAEMPVDGELEALQTEWAEWKEANLPRES